MFLGSIEPSRIQPIAAFIPPQSYLGGLLGLQGLTLAGLGTRLTWAPSGKLLG